MGNILTDAAGNILAPAFSLFGGVSHAVAPGASVTVPAGVKQFNFSGGLSNDPNLPAYLQNLTPAQLDCAINNPGCDPAQGILALLNESAMMPDYLPPADNAAFPISVSVPGWIWAVGLGVVGLAVFGARR